MCCCPDAGDKVDFFSQCGAESVAEVSGLDFPEYSVVVRCCPPIFFIMEETGGAAASSNRIFQIVFLDEDNMCADGVVPMDSLFRGKVSAASLCV